MRDRYDITRAAELTSLAAFRDLIDAACQKHPDVGPQTCYELKLAVDEACTIILTHGYAGVDPGSIMLALEFEPQQVVVNLTDFGLPFEPCEPSAPDLEAKPGDDTVDYFSLFLIYQTMDEVRYRTAEDGNHWTFVKLLGGR